MIIECRKPFPYTPDARKLYGGDLDWGFQTKNEYSMNYSDLTAIEDTTVMLTLDGGMVIF